jgi:uncharacterized protein YggE
MVVTGSATLQVSPDCADLTMTVSGNAMRPGAAVDIARKRQDALLAAFKKRGVEDGDMKLSTMSVSPEYEWTGNRQIFKGYTARITLSVTTKNFDELAPLMETGADAGATEMTSQFRRSDLEELKKQVREKALIAAKEKAAQTAKTLGIDLGRVSGVSEQGAGYLYTNTYFPQVANFKDVMSEGTVAHLGGEMQPLTLDITVTYDLPEAA